jgi:hypothetical protein
MLKQLRTAAVALVLAGGASITTAHHSAAKFDFTKNDWMSGTVKDIRVINPHMSLTLVTPDATGKPKEVVFEGHSVNNFYRMGWRNGMIVAGDQIKVHFNPRKDGVDGGFVNGFITAKGQEVVFRMPGQDLPPPPPGDTSPAPGK